MELESVASKTLHTYISTYQNVFFLFFSKDLYLECRTQKIIIYQRRDDFVYEKINKKYKNKISLFYMYVLNAMEKNYFKHRNI